ncbi:MAG TPA: winged helix-turn-helix domain-containing protein [Acidobacteriaceae bacterium]|jgi:Tol biopolymer transport system component/DNA-binding winged helix-turn-helix (wHTH) protein|nr:winged helix-turn-helix domain-containing protein [Acidobacteriaceae bacterium]
MPIPAEHQEKTAARFRFGLFEADAESGELRKSGIRIRLQAQPFRVLICLLERPGEVVTREEIQQRLWGNDTIVDFDHSLGTAINKLRESLGDSAENPRFIETLARRGYRFLAPVTVVNGHPMLAPAQSDVDFAASLTGLAPPLAHPETAADSEKAQRARGQSGGRLAFAALAGCALLAGGYIAGIWGRANYTPPPRVTQVTFSGRVGPGDLLFESFAGTATDGSRLYFSEIENGRGVLAQALIADGETGVLPLPDELAGPSLGDISPDGSRLLLRNHLATAPEQALWVVSTIGGAARRIPVIVAHDATWMPDGQRILYATGDDLYIARDNGSDNHKLVTLPGRAFWLRWSPDGTRLRLTLLNSETHTTALWEVASDGSGAHMLLQDWNNTPAAECCGSWTQDGRYFVFQSARTGDSNIWAIPEHGGFFGGPAAPIPITNGPLDYRGPITERNGRRTFFVGLDSQSELLRYDRSASLFVPDSGGLSNAKRVEFSRDGNWVAWIRQDDGSLWRSRADGTGRLQLTGRPMEVFMVHWSPDARQLVMMARQPGKPWKMYTVDADGGHLQEVLNEDRSEADPDWSPDGKQLVFGRLPDLMAEASQPKAIYLVNLATKAVTTLSESNGFFSPRWSANGKTIAALSIDQKKLMVFDVATQRWHLLAEQNIADPAWSHDDSAIYFHDFAQTDQPIYRAVVATGKVERVADLHDLRSANVVDYRFAGLAPGDVPLVSARMSTANIYAADLPR